MSRRNAILVLAVLSGTSCMGPDCAAGWFTRFRERKRLRVVHVEPLPKALAPDADSTSYVPADAYVPAIAIFSGSGNPAIGIPHGLGTYYRFSESQLERMRTVSLDRDLFLRYVERKWPIDTVRSYCIAKNRLKPFVQNLVPAKLLFNNWELPVHEKQMHGFDQVSVYVGEDTGQYLNYYGRAGTEWKRWTYSLNVRRGEDRWIVAIDSLPNDFMDNLDKYVPRQDMD